MREITGSRVVKQEVDGEGEDVDTQPLSYRGKGLVWVYFCSVKLNLNNLFKNNRETLIWGNKPKASWSYDTFISLWDGTLQSADTEMLLMLSKNLTTKILVLSIFILK